MSRLVEANPWQELQRYTQARIALGRAGDSLPTHALLQFALAHARARDAVHVPLAVPQLLEQLTGAGFATCQVHSAAPDRLHYLRRPDLGRRLDEASRERITALRADAPYDAVLVVADGLSSVAPLGNALPLLQELMPHLAGWKIAPIIVALQARVALGDEIGELAGATQCVMLIGERPGLSSPDSLGVYLTHAPRVGRSDAERNCISNVRPDGLDYRQAAYKLAYLMREARRLQISGVGLKDNSDQPAITSG